MNTTETTGIVATVKKIIAGKGNKPFTRREILAELVKKFPDKQPSSMMNTLNGQIYNMRQEGHQFIKQGKQWIHHAAAPEEPETEVPQSVTEKIKKDAPPSPLRLIRYTQDKAEELPWCPASLELEIQRFIEKHMEVCLGGIRFVASEFTIEDGRIDSLGLDKKNCPVIIEYKRNMNENVVGQAITYSFSISRHKPYFKLPVLEKFGENVASSINWKNIRILCIAEDFTQYDKSNAKAHAGMNIELIRYKFFSDNTLTLEWVAGNMPQ